MVVVVVVIAKVEKLHTQTHTFAKNTKDLNDEHNEMVENREDRNHFAIREMRKTFTLLL